MNKDQVKGRLKEGEGKVKQVTGKVVSNKELEGEGMLKKAAGNIQKNYGDLKERLKSKKDDH